MYCQNVSVGRGYRSKSLLAGWAEELAGFLTLLERFIRENQNFELLPPEDTTNDKIDLPPWLRVA